MLASHTYDQAENRMVKMPGDKTNLRTSFLVLQDGELVFDGSTHDLVTSDNPFIKEYLS